MKAYFRNIAIETAVLILISSFGAGAIIGWVALTGSIAGVPGAILLISGIVCVLLLSGVLGKVIVYCLEAGAEERWRRLD